MAKIIKFNEPSILPWATLDSRMTKICLEGVYTKGENVNELELVAAEFLGVENVVAVNSCTSGLILVLSCLGLEGEIITPSFTFSATTHAILWNSCKPIFVDIDPFTLNIDPEAIREAITEKTQAILATHIFGNPCYYHALNDIAETHGIFLIFDAAHAFGSKYSYTTKVGCGGIAEIFSLSPTKVLTAGEGGLIATNDSALAQSLRIAREYGNPGDYNTTMPGLNARMSEFNAAVALAHFVDLEKRLAKRNSLAAVYRSKLRTMGIPTQECIGYPNNSYLCMKSPLRTEIMYELHQSHIETRPYFDPPVHLQRYFSMFHEGKFPLSHTERVAKQSLCLPLYSSLGLEDISFIVSRIEVALDKNEEMYNLWK